MRQAGHSWKRMLTTATHEKNKQKKNNHMVLLLFIVHRTPADTHHMQQHTSALPPFPQRIRGSRVCVSCSSIDPTSRSQLARKPMLQQHGALIACYFMQQGCKSQLSTSNLFLPVPRFVFTRPPSSCSCADQMADALMGPALTNGAGLEFDTLTPPISAARHQEPHRTLSGKCLHCLLEFLWWAGVSGYSSAFHRTGEDSLMFV